MSGLHTAVDHCDDGPESVSCRIEPERSDLGDAVLQVEQRIVRMLDLHLDAGGGHPGHFGNGGH